MSNSLVTSDALFTCPYDTTHRIRQNRVPLHLMKCRQQHQNAPLQHCPFDTRHLVAREEMNYHMFMCEAKVLLEKDINKFLMRQASQQLPKENPSKEPQSLRGHSLSPPPSSSVANRIEESLREARIRTNLLSPLQLDLGVKKQDPNDTGEEEEEKLRDKDLRERVVIDPFKFGEKDSPLRTNLLCPLQPNEGVKKQDLNDIRGEEEEEEKLWDEDLREKGVVVQPFKFGERSLKSKYSKGSTLKGNVTPLRLPFNLVQITEVRKASKPMVYSYAMKSAGIGRGAGRGKNMNSNGSLNHRK